MSHLTRTNRYIKKVKTLTILKQNIIAEKKKFVAFYKKEPNYCNCYIDGHIDCDSCFGVIAYNQLIGRLMLRIQTLTERYEDEVAGRVSIKEP